MRLSLLMLVLTVFAGFANAASNIDPRWKTMPYPAQIAVKDGEFKFDQGFSIAFTGYTEPRLERAADRFLQALSRETGMPLNAARAKEADARLVIRTDHASAKVQEVGEDESYTLDITPQRIKLSAATPLGVLRGLATLLQAVEPGKDSFSIPAASINDKPRFPWRGTLIDACRHWMPVDVIKRNIDGLWAVKMNVLHWHLSENQGFRVESKKLPKLHELGSDGNFYTQDQVRDVIEYARDRGIRVVPEFDIPGHSTAWFVGHPEIASGPGPYSIERKWGIFDPAMDPTNEETYKLLDKLIGEMAALFPDQYFHIGGDEVNGKEWDANPRIQQFMKDHRLKDDHDLQAYFNKRVQELVHKHGKTMMGWDEILHPDLPKSILVQSWRGQKSLAEAARQGIKGLLSYGYYLDLSQPSSFHYSIDPFADGAADLTPEQKALILGGESCMWSEFVSTETVDSRLWPRNAVIAERLWSPKEITDLDSMYERQKLASAKLTHLGLLHEVNYKPMLQRIAGSDEVSALRNLVDYVEPVKEYSRGQMHDYNQQSPLNRLVDAARPESIPAVEFNKSVQRILSKGASAEEQQKVRTLLAAWKDNPYQDAAPNFLTAEVVPVAKAMSALGDLGLSALDRLRDGRRIDATEKQKQLDLLEKVKAPQSEVLIMVVPGIQDLVKATAE